MSKDDGTNGQNEDEGMIKYAVSPTELTKEAQGVEELVEGLQPVDAAVLKKKLKPPPKKN